MSCVKTGTDCETIRMADERKEMASLSAGNHVAHFENLELIGLTGLRNDYRDLANVLKSRLTVVACLIIGLYLV